MPPLPKPLIEPRVLASLLGDPSLALVDCRHELSDPEAGERGYAQGHLPGARHAHLDRDLSRAPTTSEGRHPLPDPPALARTLGHLGISNRSAVVVYDDGSGMMAARLWWLLRWAGHAEVSLLNGGLKAWIAAGLPLEQAIPSEAPDSRYVIDAVRGDRVVEIPELRALLESGSACLVDARTPERFAGTTEPIDPVAGHVPGAVNLPGSRLVTASGAFEPPTVLRERFGEVIGDRPASEIIAMCGSGVTACHLLVAMEAAGLGVGRLYAGSWSEWIRDPSRPIATQAAT